MIMECVTIAVVPGQELQFEAAVREATPLVAATPGYQVMHLHRGVERPSTYLLVIGWDSVESHMVGFRESDRFAEWRRIIGPFFAEAPQMEHFELL